MKLKEVFEKSVQFFKDKKIESARLDAEILISAALKIDRLQIYLKYEQPLSENEIQLCRESIRRRGLGEPVAYITGEKGFYGEIFKVGTGVLIPRPETELIVEQVLENLNKRLGSADKTQLAPVKILDLGAGSGCIGFAILKNTKLPARLTAVERSAEAFSYLKQNCENLNLTEQVNLINDDAMTFEPDSKFDFIVMNPPYISSDDPEIEKNVKMFEPASALFAEQNGLADIVAWATKYKKYLEPNGVMLIEMGYKQGEAVSQSLKAAGFNKVQILKDLSGLDRIIKAQHN